MKRWVYTEGGRPLPEPIEVSDDYSDAPRSTGDLGKFEYDNARAPDGTDISSRTKLNRYLKESGLALAGDFKGQWESQQKQREAASRGEKSEADKRRHREAIGREAYRKKLIRY